jgi:hypothetical protein
MVEIGNRIESADKYGYYHAILADRDIYISKTEYNYRMNQLEGWLDKSNTKRAELEAQLAAAQEREVAYRNALMDAAKDFNQAGMGNCCQRVLDELNRIINAAEADHADN